MLRIAICDDNEYVINNLKDAVHNGFSKITDKFILKCFTNGKMLLENNAQIPFDVIFLDIDMPETDGFEIAKKLRDGFNQCFIIFVTDHSELVYRSFDFQPFNFIPKSSASALNENVSAVIRKLMEYMKQYQKITLENEEETTVAYYHNIIFVESDKHYLLFHIKNREDAFRIRGSINEIASELEKYDFLRIHRCFIVNMNYIKSIDKKIGKVCINYNDTRKTLSLGRNYKEEADEKYILYLRNVL